MTHRSTLAYRSPDVVIDGRRWHLAVYGSRMVYRFHDGRAWRPVTQWPGRKPKGLGESFRPYRRHAFPLTIPVCRDSVGR